MFKNERKIPELEKLNLVPIMDAVFIFIFFLLFSAQFIKIFEIETAAPIVSEVPQDVKLDKDPLNLMIKVYQRKIELVTGVDQDIQETYFKKDTQYPEKIKEKVLSLRLKHPKEDFIVISPAPDIEYNEIIQVIDMVQTLPKDNIYKVTVDGKVRTLGKIFTQLVLEPMDEL
ncbi:MAG: biopolymer transport protein ExbD [Bacteriovoracaceae bacterium]|jgi:biopolymer transport protein ExbD